MLKNNQGYTLLNTLFAFSVFLLVISFFPVTIKIIKTETPTASYNIDLFFEYIQTEIAKAKQLSTSGSTLYLSMDDGTIIQFQKFNTNIRRQVDGLGNEFYLQNVTDVDYELVSNGVIVSVELAGRRVNKRFSMAPKL